jgi:hypothetical protein
MSAIDTGQIDTAYPVPGINNSSQGFRTNFTAIKSGLDTASNEITDLQTKAVVKSALTGIPLNNDMSNTLISNALVQGFRATTYNLGNNLSGTVTVDITNGDVQYGTITANTVLAFSKWAPAGTQSNVQTIFTIANTQAVVTLPNNITDGMLTIENYSGNGVAGGNLIAPANVTKLHHEFTTTDCGTNVTMLPIDRPRKTTQIVTSVPTSNVGVQGDKAGTVATDSTYFYVCTGDYDGATVIWKRVTLSAW